MTRWIESDGGVRIAVEESPGDPPPVLWVHGFGHQRQVWDGVIARSQSGRRAIRMDLRGHGESSWSVAGDYAVRDYARDLPRVLDALGIERAAIVAHSLGGNAATLAAATLPERVSGLVLVDTGPSLSLAGMQQVAAGVTGALRSWPSVADQRDSLAASYPLADEAALDRLAETGLVERADGRVEPRLDPAVLTGDVDPEAIGALEQELWAALARIEAPTLIVRGATSAMLSAEIAARMAGHTAGSARLEVIERAGHSIMLDAAGELARVIDAFLAADQAPCSARCSSSAASQASRLSS